MTADEYKNLFAFEADLKIGDKVMFYWTNSGNYFKARAIIEKINRKSFRVTLDEAVEAAYGTYPVGNSMIAPRIGNFDVWSWNNRVGPPE